MAAARRQRSGEFRRTPSLEEQIDRGQAMREREPSRDTFDLLDVPATVVCARCGDADCGGCDSELSRSGIVSVVAWERPGTPAMARMWSTARATTRDAEAFFELLPDGPLMPAVRFAIGCELIATGAAFVTVIALATLVAPEWMKSLALDPVALGVAFRVAVLGVPAFAGLLVLAHALHGLSIDVGAARSGVRSDRTRALRFGLYACGWDLVMGPVGAAVVAWREGLRAAASLPRSLHDLPTRATRAFVRGCYRLEGDHALRAVRTSYLGAAVATIAFTAIVIGVVVAILAA